MIIELVFFLALIVLSIYIFHRLRIISRIASMKIMDGIRDRETKLVTLGLQPENMERSIEDNVKKERLETEEKRAREGSGAEGGFEVLGKGKLP